MPSAVSYQRVTTVHNILPYTMYTIPIMYWYRTRLAFSILSTSLFVNTIRLRVNRQNNITLHVKVARHSPHIRTIYIYNMICMMCLRLHHYKRAYYNMLHLCH